MEYSIEGWELTLTSSSVGVGVCVCVFVCVNIFSFHLLSFLLFLARKIMEHSLIIQLGDI